MKTFPTSAVWCFGILFISVSLITTGSSEVQVVGSADRVVALAGDDIILPCSLKPSVSAEDMIVQWTRLNLKTTNKVHLYREGRDSNEEQFPSYRGRTSMFHEELKKGNVSLKLTRVTLSDTGNYRCFIPTLMKETTVQLFVGAVSQPVISIDGTKDWGVVLKCESGGWFPEPQMEWLDSSGTILPADGPPENHRDSDDLYAVRRHVTVDQTDTNRFTCRVHQTEINHLKETEINVSGELRKENGELRQENGELRKENGELRKENEKLKKDNGEDNDTNQPSTSPGGKQETQTPSQKSEEMEMESAPGSGGKSVPEKKPLLGSKNDDLERGGS